MKIVKELVAEDVEFWLFLMVYRPILDVLLSLQNITDITIYEIKYISLLKSIGETINWYNLNKGE